MKFIMNDREWTIKEVSQDELQAEHTEEIKEYGEAFYFGTTFPDLQEIWIWKELTFQQKIKTLIHELTHCYIYSYISFNDIKLDTDDFCDINANSFFIIKNIIEKYEMEVNK